MKVKKIVISLILLNFFFFLVSPYLIKPKKVEAAAPVFARIAKDTVGEKFVISLMEKSGVKFATKNAREKAVEKWNMELYKKIEEANKFGDKMKADELARFQNQLVNANKADVIPVKGKPGFGQILLDSTLFLLGADLAYEITTEIINAYESNQAIESMKDIMDSIGTGETLTEYAGFFVYLKGNNIYIGNGVYETPFGENIYGYKSVSGVITNVEKRLTSTEYYTLMISVSMLVTRGDGYVFRWDRSNGVNIPYSATLPDYKIVSSIPQSTDIPDVVPISIPDTLPPQIPIVIPDYDLDLPYPWNDPLPDSNKPPITSPIPEGNKNPIPNKNPDINKDLNPTPEATPLPVPETDLPLDEPPIPPSSDACKSPATDLLEFFKNSLIGNFACLNWNKLKMSGGFFTNKFPFSIPWDVGRALTATFGGLSASDEIPEYQLKIKDWETTLTIPEFFHKWFRVIRVMLLVMFDIGLVWGVRKMLGGAS